MNEDTFNSEKLLNHLIDIAKKDGIITDDEQNFINVMKKEITTYEEKFKESLEDGEITPQEKLSLFHSRLKILRKALDAVLDDLEVNKDEHDLLEGLKIKLLELAELEKNHMK